METITIALLTADEAGRYLPSALRQWSQFADSIAVLDNGQDGTLGLVEKYFPVHNYERWAEPVWGQETPARAKLWQMALEMDSDWILVLDSDMVPARSPKSLLDLIPDWANGICFNLYDLWDETAQNDQFRPFYRTDGPWKAHENWRLWMVRRPTKEPAEGWLWSGRGIHSGHFPGNLRIGHSIYAPADYGLLHYSYLDPDDRERKYLQYSEVSDQLSEPELRHANSIMDPDPQMARLEFEPEFRLSKP